MDDANYGCKLAPMYHSAMKKITGAIITSPNTAVLCESRQLPLDHVVVLKLVNLAGRLIEKGIEANPFVDRANKVLKQLTGHSMPNIAKLTSCSTRPWYHKIPTIDLTLQKLSKHEQ